MFIDKQYLDGCGTFRFRQSICNIPLKVFIKVTAASLLHPDYELQWNICHVVQL